MTYTRNWIENDKAIFVWIDEELNLISYEYILIQKEKCELVNTRIERCILCNTQFNFLTRLHV